MYDDSTDTTRKATFAWDALGRRIESVNDLSDRTTEYWYDGVNEIDEKTTQAGEIPTYTNRYYIHGISYIDERLLMIAGTKPYYYVLDRMYNVRMLLDRAGAIVERYAYDSYGRPLIRESCGRGDMNNTSTLTSTDTSRFDDAYDDIIWDPRADMDDDGDVDSNDQTLYDAKLADWGGAIPSVDPRQAFSDVDNPFMFQGVPHFALDTASNATAGKLMLNHHRARFADPVTGRWVTRDPIHYNELVFDLQSPPKNLITARRELGQKRNPARAQSVGLTQTMLSMYLVGTTPNPHNLYNYLETNPIQMLDPTGGSCMARDPVPLPCSPDQLQGCVIQCAARGGRSVKNCTAYWFPSHTVVGCDCGWPCFLVWAGHTTCIYECVGPGGSIYTYTRPGGAPCDAVVYD